MGMFSLPTFFLIAVAAQSSVGLFCYLLVVVTKHFGLFLVDAPQGV